MRCGSGGGKSGLLHHGVVRNVVVHGGAKEPVRTGRLRPVQTGGGEIVAERDRNTRGDGDGIDAQDPIIDSARCGELRQGIEFGLAGRAIGNAGVFVYVFEGRKKTDFVSDRGATESSDIVLTRKGLFGIGSRVVNRKTRIEIRSPAVEPRVAVPLVGPALGGDDHGCGGRPAGVRILLRRADRKFLDRIGRKILEKAANPIIGIVAAVHGIFIIEARTAAGGKRGSTGFGGIGRLKRFRSRG